MLVRSLLLSCALLASCSSNKYVSVVVLETNCGEFDGAIFVRGDGFIHVEHDPGLANGMAEYIPADKGLKVIDGPCRSIDSQPQYKDPAPGQRPEMPPGEHKEPRPTPSQGVI